MFRLCAARAVVAVFFFVVGATVGCVIPSRSVLPNERLRAANDEAYLALIVDVPRSYAVALALCQDGDVNRCITVGPQNSDDGFRLYAMPPARWCLQQLVMENGAMGIDHVFTRDEVRCFDVAVGAVTYPGHFGIEVQSSRLSAVRTRHGFTRIDGVEPTLHAAFPETAALPLLTVEPARIESSSSSSSSSQSAPQQQIPWEDD